MPVYEYEHLEEPCAFGKVFEYPQPIKADPLEFCPKCDGPVRRIVSRPNINTPRTASELKNLGFTKLVKRDEGVYENVTRRNGEARYMERDKPETKPDISKIITD